MTTSSEAPLSALLAGRFRHRVRVPDALEGETTLCQMAARGSCRRFRDDPVAPDLIETLCAVALSGPTKSDLQQRDIIVVTEPGLKSALLGIAADQPWTQGEVPVLIVFCGNHARQRQLHDLAGHTFTNDHLDAFFNAAVDAGIVLAGFVAAAEAAGLGACPISALRNRPDEVDRLLGLPRHVFPVAGLALGHPAVPAPVSQRLPLSETLRWNGWGSGDPGAIERYDAERRSHQPYATERLVPGANPGPGNARPYGWIEDKARQYARPERAGFGAYIRGKGFSLD
ncbi:nitroreductase family protein [Pontitalea aquivivens]|uniref:nitroreductase family protein n=1 Tax=Pontitalea aquivivens TaxID=3388663 RepID=UPI0039708A86